MNDIHEKTPLWRKILPYSPLVLLAALLFMSRNPLSANPAEPPSSLAGPVYDLSFSPL